jgi:hypothetical protein
MNTYHLFFGTRQIALSVAAHTLIILLAGCGGSSQREKLKNDTAPFRPLVESVSRESSDRQYEYFARLSMGLMAEDYAAFTGQRHLPHFGHLVQELYQSQKLDLLRTMLRRGEIPASHYLTIADKLSRQMDAEAFEIISINAERNLAKTLEASGEDIDAYSALCLGNYLTNGAYSSQAETRLLSLLRGHGYPGVRAFAAEALVNARSRETIGALEEATHDNGRVHTLQGPYDTVGEYARDTLNRITK